MIYNPEYQLRNAGDCGLYGTWWEEESRGKRGRDSPPALASFRCRCRPKRLCSAVA
jgi:hypothetical protein